MSVIYSIALNHADNGQNSTDHEIDNQSKKDKSFSNQNSGIFLFTIQLSFDQFPL